MKYPIRFAKYLLLERVNVGGMAEVFKAKTFGVEGFQRNLAIKCILPNMSEDIEFINMFVDEARLAVELNHANIVQIYELGKHHHQYYIAMEYIAGKDLRRVVEWYRKRKATMPVPLAAYICSKICEGLDYAHRKLDSRGNPINLVHRDVSPQNILVSFEGDVKVIDFGIAKAADRLSKTQAGVLKGKFGYMSPEQVAGMEIDRRSDLFAVGVLLYEMLTCQRLFVAESDFSTLEKVRQCEIPPMRERSDTVPEELEHVVRTALAKDLNERYQWCSDFAEALQPFLITDKTIFNAKRLASFMKDTFKEDIEQEMQRMQEFARITDSDVPAAHGSNWNGGTNVVADPRGTQPVQPKGEGMQIFDVNNDALASAHTQVGSVEDVEREMQAAGGTGSGRPARTMPQAPAPDLNQMATEVFDGEAMAQVKEKLAALQGKPARGNTNPGSNAKAIANAAVGEDDEANHTRRFDPLERSIRPPSKQNYILTAAGVLAILIVLAALWYRWRTTGPELAWVVLRIIPLGVPIEFYVDEQLVAKGTTPLDNYQLAVGKHQLRIEADVNYQNVATPVEFKPGTNQVDLTLVPRAEPPAPPVPTPTPAPTASPTAVSPPQPTAKKVSVDLDTDPLGAAIYLAGQKVGHKVESEVGKVLALEAKKAGYKPAKLDHVVTGDDKVVLRLEKEERVAITKHDNHDKPERAPSKKPDKPAKGGIGFLIIATPGNPDTRVIVDGKDTKRATPIPPNDPIKIGAGAHNLTLVFKDNAKSNIPVQIVAGETFKVIEKKK